jgi:enoyl-CoA hydratase
VNPATTTRAPTTNQRFANFFDGVARHSPEGLWFRQRAVDVGFKQAVAERDSGDPIAEGQSKRLGPARPDKD